ncbi:carboxypeptidase M32 [Enterococcus timonensis]|uniref:carboxypeptidase M32 n=1 Tax=Enterococcus timonensis TaxID=1852364 RepID=UPI0008D982E0|nr:carboxypeptidase M32 [Enterococcus timonensis]
MSQVTEVDFLALIKKEDLLNRSLALLEWDEQTGMPEAASEYRSEMNSLLTELRFETANGSDMKNFLTYFENHQDQLSEVGKSVYQQAKKDFDLFAKIDQDDYVAYQKDVSKAYSAWAKARKAKDFQIFAPSLEKIVAHLKQFIPLWQKDEKTPYDVLLNQYEPGMTVEILDEVFAQLLAGITKIRQTLKEKGTEPEIDFLHRFVSKEQQQQFVRALAEKVGYDFKRGRLDDTIHPFMTGINRLDARITTRWDEHDFMMATFGVIHEAGHGVYEQNVDPKFDYTNLSGGVSMGIHESQSLFNEIIIGSSKNFWQTNYPMFQEITGDTFADISFEDFYRSMKQTKSSLIRIEADPLTYPIHIIIRYEIEKELFNGNLAVADLPKVWAEKYQEYLGVTPANDLEGVLQDVHWSGGSFGYFPSYALGYMYAAQLYDAMNEDQDVEEILLTDDYSPIVKWNTEKIHQYGASKQPNWLMEQACGQQLNPQHLLNYLQKIYFDVYQVK